MTGSRRHRRRRNAAEAMALAVWLAAGSTAAAFGQAGQADCDEAMYITMDPYGGITEASVVKSYSLYGTKEIVDYGDYLEVNNMTDYTVPHIDGSQVVFRLQEDSDIDRFYFEGKLEPEQAAKSLPWDIHVTYRLNGVERTLEEIAHEKGLVEILIDILPDRDAGDYYKNNMTLEVASVVDMEKNLSVEAPGAQIQSAGSMKAVLFMVFPGEEQHFELRIGSDDFQFGGLMFLMVPVTLSQLDDLGELRDARDTVKDSADAISDSLDVLLDSLEGIEQGLHTTVDGLQSLEQSRQAISGRKEGIYIDADKALEILMELSDRGIPFTGYVEEARNALEDGNADINDLTDLVEALDDDLEDLGWDLSDVRDDLKSTGDILDNAGNDLKEWESQLEKLKKDLEQLKSAKEKLEKKGARAQTYMDSLQTLRDSLEGHEDIMGISPEEVKQLKDKLDKILGAGLPQLPQEEFDRLIASASDALRQLQESMGGITPDPGLVQLIEQLKKLTGGVGDQAAARLDSLIEEVQGQIDALETMISRVRVGGESISYVLSDSRDVISTLKRGGSSIQDVIGQVSAVRGTVNAYHQTAVEAAEDTGRLIDSAVKGTDAMYRLMSDVENTLRQAGVPLDRGARITIEGLSEALNHGIEGLSRTTTIRDAKTTVEDLIEDKWDEYTGEKMNLLNADVNARKVSFTSAGNREPQSLQIILRTQGTGETEKEPEAEVDEAFHAQGNFLDRIWNILKEIARAISSIFR